jgi:hypothetical protein
LPKKKKIKTQSDSESPTKKIVSLEEKEKTQQTKKEQELESMGVFCIQRFLKTAKEEFNLKEGKWFRSTTFLMGLDYILKANPKAIEGVDLQVYNMNDNIIFLKDVFSKIFDPIKGDTFKLGELSAMKDNQVTQLKLSDVINMDKVSFKIDDDTCGKEEEIHKQKPGKQPLEEERVLFEKTPNKVSEELKKYSSKTKETVVSSLTPTSQSNVKVKQHVHVESEDEDRSRKSSNSKSISVKNKEIAFSESDSFTCSHFDFPKLGDYFEYLKNHEVSRPLLLCLNTMLGLNQIDTNNRSFIEALFKIQSFVGMLGGKENKAFYFFGFDDKYFYYLDPHYVKASHDNSYSDREYLEDYFVKNIFKTEYRKISPSISVCFLIHSSKGGYFSDFPVNIIHIYNFFENIVMYRFA